MLDTQFVGHIPGDLNEVPRHKLRCHLHKALPCLRLILLKQPAFANNVAFDRRSSINSLSTPRRIDPVLVSAGTGGIFAAAEEIFR
jgi:hypothetical protein